MPLIAIHRQGNIVFNDSLNIHFQRIETLLLDIDLNSQFGYNAKQWLQACLEPVNHMQLVRKIALHLFCGLVQTKENWL